MFKDRIKEMRARLNMTQEAFGAAVGINERTVWRLEKGHIPHPNILAKISSFSGVDAHLYFSVDEWKQFENNWAAQAHILLTKDEKAPLCLCGCGETVGRNVHTKGEKLKKGQWGRYKRGHWGKWSGVEHDLSANNRNEYMRLYRLANLERETERSKKQYRKVKLLVIAHYTGGKNQCMCCGESIIEFLTVDHIIPKRSRNDPLSCGGGLYANLRKLGFPEGFQILCFNCNCAKRTFETCPHQWDEKDRISIAT